MRVSSNRGSFAILAYAVLFLFFLQLITDFIAGIYAFGLLRSALPAEMAMMVVFLSPFLLVLYGRGPSTTLLVIMAELVLLCRGLEVLLPTRFQLIVAGLGTGIFLFLFPALLWQLGQKSDRTAGASMTAGLTLALAASILLRTLGSTMDLSNEGWFRLIPWLLGLGTAVLMPGVFRGETAAEEPSSQVEIAERGGKVIAPAIGTAAVFTLLLFGFAAPAVISRWTGSNYLLILSGTVLSLVLFAWVVSRATLLKRLSRKVALLGTAVFILALTLTLVVHQAALPADPSGYPMIDPGVNSLWGIAMAVTLLLFPILIVCFGLLIEEMTGSRPALRRLGLGFGLASLFMLIMILGNVFTTVWSFVTNALEPVSRGRFPHVHAIVGLVVLLSLLAVKSETVNRFAEAAGQRIGRGAAITITTFGAIALIAAFILDPSSEAGPATPGRLKIAGWNVFQGYGEDGQRGHREQCEVLKEINADVIALSETDSARIAGGNFDVPRFLAECLDMDSYVGPKTGIGTFGYALLSRYPILNPVTYHLFSDPGLPSSSEPGETSSGDQVALIKAQIAVAGGETYNVFVNHFASNPPREQAEGLLKLVGAVNNVIAIGDFNCGPDSVCFEIITDVLDHCADTTDDPAAAAAEDKIDHIFVSPGLRCPNFTYVDSTASDHPAVVAEIAR